MKSTFPLNLKTKTIIVLVLALLLSFIIYFFIIKFYINPYIEEYSDIGRSQGIFEFYREKIYVNNAKNFNENISLNSLCMMQEKQDIYYWGPSSTKEGIDASLIDSLNSSFNNYNLGNPASSPLKRIIELERAIDSNPSAIVINIGYMSLSNQWLFPYDHYSLVAEYVNIENFEKTSDFYNQTYKDALGMNPLKLLLFKRKFIYPASNIYIEFLRHKIIGTNKPPYFGRYNIDFKSEGRLLQVNETQDENFIKKLSKKEDFSEYEIKTEKNIEKESLEFIIQELSENNIKVIIVKFPLNPNLLDKIPQESKDNFDNYLNKVSEKYNVPVLDYISDYDEGLFYDGHHLSLKGRDIFSKELGLEIIKLIGDS